MRWRRPYLWIGLAALAAAVAVPWARAAGASPGPVLNEVHFDPIGPDGGFEWIEIAAPGGAALGGWRLEDLNGVLLYTFPPGASIPAAGHALIVLGPPRPGWMAVLPPSVPVQYTGTTWDAISNDPGALLLRNASGQVADFVAWSLGAVPSGPAYQEAVAAGEWPAGGFVDLSVSSGSPRLPGETIGRAQDSSDTDSPSDWAANGGPDAVGQTPGQRNDADVENQEGLIELQQELVNRAFLAYGLPPAEPLRFSVTKSDVDSVLVKSVAGASAYSVSAQHTFFVTDQKTGLQETWTGSLESVFSSPGNRKASVTVQGTLQAGTDALRLDYRRQRSGFGGVTVSDDETTSLGLKLNGVEYPIDTTSSHETEMLAANRIEERVNRTESNWSTTTPMLLTLQRTTNWSGESRADLSWSVQIHDFSGYPPLGSPPTSAPVVLDETGSGTLTLTSPEEYRIDAGKVTYSVGGTVVGQSAGSRIVEVRRIQGVPGDVLGTFTVDADTIIDDGLGGPPIADVRLDDRQDLLLDGSKHVTSWQTSMSSSGAAVASAELYIDPPVQTIVQQSRVVNITTVYDGVDPDSGFHGKGVARKIARWGGAAGIMAACYKLTLDALPAGPVVAARIETACNGAMFAWTEIF